MKDILKAIYGKHITELVLMLLFFGILVLYPNVIAPSVLSSDGNTKTVGVRKTEQLITQYTNRLVDQWCNESKNCELTWETEFLSKKSSQAPDCTEMDFEVTEDMGVTIWKNAIYAYQQVLYRQTILEHNRDLCNGESSEILTAERREKAYAYDEIVVRTPKIIMMNSTPLETFLANQKYECFFLLGILLAVFLWGPYLRGWMDRLEATTPLGKKGIWVRHLHALLLIVTLEAVDLIIALIRSGLLWQFTDWKSSVLLAGSLFSSQCTMSIGSFLAVYAVNLFLNALFWYLLAYCLLKHNRNVMHTCFYLTAIIIVLYMTGNFLNHYSLGSVIQIGYCRWEDILNRTHWFCPQVSSVMIGFGLVFLLTVGLGIYSLKVKEK